MRRVSLNVIRADLFEVPPNTIEWTLRHRPATLLAMGSRLGVMKTAARRAGVPLDEYQLRIDAGEKWCRSCRAFEPISVFGIDLSRGDGFASECRASKAARPRRRYSSDNPAPGRRRLPPREGDAEQARGRVSTLINAGVIPPASALSCFDCGDTTGASRHEYDHYLGYGSAHHEDVQAVCASCHHKRELARRKGRRS